MTAVGAAFAFGVAVGALEIFPYGALERGAAAVRDWIRYPRHNARLHPEKYLAHGVTAALAEGGAAAAGLAGSDTESGSFPGGNAGAGERNDRGAIAYRGTTLVDGFFGDTTGLRLLDMDGRVLHEWRVPFSGLWPEPEHLERDLHDWDAQIHGAILYPNGDVVLNFQYAGLARIDRCGRPIWRVAQQTHHSVHQDASGHLWVPSRRIRREPHPNLPSAPLPFYEDVVLEVSPDGRVVREISVIDALAASDLEGLLLANGEHAAEIDPPMDGDFTHLNDVEILPASMSGAFPMFAAGDMLLSLRNLNLLLVLDGETAAPKWWMVGPHVRQHDPDFLPSGKISVFDNRRDGQGGDALGGSRILEIDPLTRAVSVVYGGRRGERFYTETMGDHQRLPNGNVLITESENGTAFEVTRSGKQVWSYVNVWDEESAAMIGRAVRYPEGYVESIETEGCQ